ncbi:AraC family transcriptional regulator [Agrilactobacillus fermenti]|uniref:AraC family transcriptional regulator n=1 Tax=Agrilactobacillus fermenti TaxID=2586909 RepID=UPI001E411C3C|nr:helix-turn-helix domain-containing protein [Agrilactobacillus fermenti]MCD2256698.1 helix-turn-helix domain-containing protein [Agrilactobacillus fermenti]
MNAEILDYLTRINPIEKKQLKSKQFHNDIPNSAVNKNLTIELKTPVLNNYYFKNKDIFVRKHNRFAPYPTHAHEFLEMNYMLKGQANEVVNGESVHLGQGDLILLDVGCRHSIGTLSKEDIMINILFRDQDINIDMLNELRSNQSVFYEFLVNRAVKRTNQKSYLIFRSDANGNSEIQVTLDHIIEEYFGSKPFANAIIKDYLSILFIQIVRNYKIKARPTTVSQQLVMKLLKEINRNYQNITLDKLAKKFNYNKNYLSNLFKQEVGKTFSDALTQERLIHARTMVTSTTMPIADIMESVGISNKKFFYDKYKAAYHTTPGKDRSAAENKKVSTPFNL